eukprot:gene7344-5284_t
MAKKSEMGNESCFVLPGGESVLAATMKSRKSHADGKKSYRIYDYDGKRGMLLNVPPPTQRDLPPINWDSTSRRSTARDNGTGNQRTHAVVTERSNAPQSSRPGTSGAALGSGRIVSSRSIQGAGTVALSSHRQR